MYYYKNVTTSGLDQGFKTQRHKDRAVNNIAFTLMPLWHQFTHTHVSLYEQSFSFLTPVAPQTKSLVVIYGVVQ